ncbi:MULTISPECIES: PQ-loop domain-containing transporter [unclassified Mycoplasma]|uniref:PQ-loop domain-containing transporter n=1 Tax=unclassified Mycoplasma TaxID=2683645 RepID=UPI000FDE305E
MNIYFELFGIIGGILVTISFLPNAIRTIQTKQTANLSLSQYLIFHLGALFFMIYGIVLLIANGPGAYGAYGLIVSNAIALLMNSIVIFYIFRNRRI